MIHIAYVTMSEDGPSGALIDAAVLDRRPLTPIDIEKFMSYGAKPKYCRAGGDGSVGRTWSHADVLHAVLGREDVSVETVRHLLGPCGVVPHQRHFSRCCLNSKYPTAPSIARLLKKAGYEPTESDRALALRSYRGVIFDTWFGTPADDEYPYPVVKTSGSTQLMHFGAPFFVRRGEYARVMGPGDVVSMDDGYSNTKRLMIGPGLYTSYKGAVTVEGAKAPTDAADVLHLHLEEHPVKEALQEVVDMARHLGVDSTAAVARAVTRIIVGGK